MKTAIVSTTDIAAAPGAPLTPDYWMNKREGEDYPAFRARQALVKRLKVTRRQLVRVLASLDKQIAAGEESR